MPVGSLAVVQSILDHPLLFKVLTPVGVAQPVPFWESPASFHLPPPSPTASAAAATSAAPPLPIPMPTRQNTNGGGASILAAAAASVSEAGSPFDRASDIPRSLPIVLSPSFLSSEDDEEEEGSSQYDAEVDALMDSEAAASTGAAESEAATEDEVKPSTSVGWNGGNLTPRRLASRSSFSRTRSSSFNSTVSAGGFPI